MEPARRLSTYEDLLALEDGDTSVPELIDGEIRYKASPRATHAYAQGQVRGALHGFGSGGSDGWWILVEPDVRLSIHRVLRPDVAAWRRSRLPRLPDGPVDLPPDWVCEVLSPGHEAHDRLTKRAIYAQHGVPHLWLVHPDERTVEAFELVKGRWVLLGTWTSGEARIPPFESAALDIDAWFVPRDVDAPPLAKEPEIRYA